MRRPVGAPRYPRSCGSWPTIAPGCTTLSAPSHVSPVRNACAITRVRGPMRTGPSITTYGPTSAVGSTSARRSTTALGWIGTQPPARMNTPGSSTSLRALPFGVGPRQLGLGRDRVARDPVPLVGPGREVEQLAALGAEGTVRIALPRRRAATARAANVTHACSLSVAGAARQIAPQVDRV